MITEALLNMWFGIWQITISTLPATDFTINTDWIGTLITVVSTVSYFLPLQALFPIIYISFGLSIFNLVWKIILRAKSFVPTMGV